MKNGTGIRSSSIDAEGSPNSCDLGGSSRDKARIMAIATPYPLKTFRGVKEGYEDEVSCTTTNMYLGSGTITSSCFFVRNRRSFAVS